MKYRTVDIKIDAVQWKGDNLDEVKAMLPGFPVDSDGDLLIVRGEKGIVKALPGDYVIAKTSGDPYSMPSPVFDALYEPLESRSRKLKLMLDSKGWTAADLSRKAGISYTSSWEAVNRGGELSAKGWASVANALGVSLDWLLA